MITLRPNTYLFGNTHNNINILIKRLDKNLIPPKSDIFLFGINTASGSSLPAIFFDLLDSLERSNCRALIISDSIPGDIIQSKHLVLLGKTTEVRYTKTDASTKLGVILVNNTSCLGSGYEFVITNKLTELAHKQINNKLGHRPKIIYRHNVLRSDKLFSWRVWFDGVNVEDHEFVQVDL